MKRIIMEYAQLPTGQARIITSSPTDILIHHEGKMYVDYLVSSQTVTPEGAFYVGEMLPDGTVLDIVGTVTGFPHGFTGWDRTTPALEKPVIRLSADTANIMLLRSGYLSTIESIVNAAGPEVIIRWQKAPYLDSDNVLANQVLAMLGLTEEQRYQLFVDAARDVAFTS